MPRYRLDLEYNGSHFKGFQAQGENLLTVQGVLEEAIYAFCRDRVRIQTAGRTDAGVHALGQVSHVDLTKAWPDQVVCNALNAHLVPHSVTVLAAREVDLNFHARFSAKGRSYLYRILDRRPPPALLRQQVGWVKTPLNVEAMADAAQIFLGTHDFTTFRDMACQAKSPIKTLDQLSVTRQDDEVHLCFSARSFLHRQVRSMTGSLIEVGLGRWDKEKLDNALKARDRRACGPVAPAFGLYLKSVAY